MCIGYDNILSNAHERGNSLTSSKYYGSGLKNDFVVVVVVGVAGELLLFRNKLIYS